MEDKETEKVREKIVTEMDIGVGHKKMFEVQNSYMEAAIKSLDQLNDQIVQFIFSPKASELDLDNDLSAEDRQALQNSMSLMRRLLLDAQAKFRKMVEDNKRLASKIENSITTANHEVNLLRGELEDTNRRLSMISESTEELKPREPDNDLVALQQRLQATEEERDRVQQDNGRLGNLVNNLQQTIEELRRQLSENKISEEAKSKETKLDIIQTRQELIRTKEALQALRADRKRLKAEKLDLLNQMKQLYCTMEDKEAELRDFIRNYEQRMKENDTNLRMLAADKEESEAEKWEILKRAREATERCILLRNELDHKDTQLKQVEVELAQARDQLAAMGHSTSTSLRTSLASDIPPSPAHSSGHAANLDDLPPPQSDVSHRSNDSCYSTYTSSSMQNGSVENVLPSVGESRSSEDVTSAHIISMTSSTDHVHMRRKRRSLGFFSPRRSHRKSINISDPSLTEDFTRSMLVQPQRLSVLNAENFSQKLKMIEQAKAIPVTLWKANHVLAWLEIEANMPTYGKMCAENIKSGRILLGLSDAELDSALNIQRPLHRRKLRLAIEELREPSTMKYAKAGKMDHTWVAHRWICDLGLSQYKELMEQNLVDGRLLQHLTKKDLEKQLGIQKKFHQTSIMHGIELLKRISFDKEVLNQRRSKSEDTDSDLLVWTNERIIKWVNSIDLEEYSSNLRESGVHGALLVMESSFNSEAFASALCIPTNKSYVRRHLQSELDIILKAARSSLSGREKKKPSGGTLGHNSFIRSFQGPGPIDESSQKKISFRGSLGRAFSRRSKADIKFTPDDISAPTPNSTQKSRPKRSRSTELISKVMNSTPV